MNYRIANEIMRTPEFNSKFLCLLKHFLVREHITQEELAKSLDVTRQAVNIWFHKRSISTITIIAITVVIGVLYLELVKCFLDKTQSEVLNWVCTNYETMSADKSYFLKYLETANENSNG